MYLSEKQIKKRIKELGNEITLDYKDLNPIFIGVLNGSFVFLADLIRECKISCEIDFLRVKSYINNERSSLQFTKKWELDLEGRNLIIVEDIADSGSTLNFLLTEINKSNPKSISICSLLKRHSCKNIQINYLGFEVEDDAFLIGFGLDNNGLMRNLKYIKKL